jgi:hypothetical protein
VGSVRAGLAIVMAAGIAVWPAGARAAVSDFVPRPQQNSAWLEIFASTESDENSSGTRSSEWTDDFLREKITFSSNGYVYHPRFLQYQASLAGAIKQENYDASFLEPPGWQGDSGIEYDGRLFFLPDHPYSLELYGLRYEPLFKEQAATERTSVESSHGAVFRYRQKPFFFDARYSHDGIDTPSADSDVTRFGLNGEYFTRWGSANQFSVNAGYNPSRFTNTLGSDGTTTERFITPVLDLQRVKLTLSASDNTADQSSGPAGRFSNEQLSLYELLTIHLPLSFRTDLAYRIHDNTSETRNTGTSQDRELTDLSKDLEVTVVHKLYESLDTRYVLLHIDRDSTDGDSISLSQNLQVNYTKRIPRGRVQMGSYVGRGSTENMGRSDVVNEPHAGTAVPGTFVLAQTFAEAGGVEVFLRSPLAPFDIIRLQELVHYTLTVVGNTVQVNLLTLPPQFTVPGTYDLFVNYSLTTGDFELDSDSFGTNASVQLLDDLLTPYAGYGTVSFQEVRGTFPGIPLDTRTWTGGLLVHKGPVRGRAEYQSVEWDVSPYRSWRGEVQVVSTLDARTRLYGTLSHLNKRFTEGTGDASSDPYTEASTTVSGSLQRQIPGWNMLLSGGGSYARLDGLVDSTAWSANAAVSWKVGRMDLTLGMNGYRSETEGTGAVMTERDERYVYLKLRRELY